MAGQCFSMETLVSSTNKTDSQNIAEILLKGMLNTMSITLTLEIQYASIFFLFGGCLSSCNSKEKYSSIELFKANLAEMFHG